MSYRRIPGGREKIDQELVAMFKRGLSQSIIAARMKVHQSTVSRALKNAGIPPQRPWGAKAHREGT